MEKGRSEKRRRTIKDPEPPGRDRRPLDSAAVVRKGTRLGPPAAKHRAEELIPKTEAITIRNPKLGSTYADIMKKVMADVNLQEICVDVQRTRRTKNGAILLEVKGVNEADVVAARIKDAIRHQARVSRPSRLTKVLVTNIADWLEEGRVIDDIRLADAGLCSAPITVRENAGGGRIAIITATISIALRLNKAGFIKIGLSKCRVKLIEGQKVRCYRCDGLGHMAGSCSAAPAERKCCRCHKPGHLIANFPGGNSAKNNEAGGKSPFRASPGAA